MYCNLDHEYRDREPVPVACRAGGTFVVDHAFQKNLSDAGCEKFGRERQAEISRVWPCGAVRCVPLISARRGAPASHSHARKLGTPFMRGPAPIATRAVPSTADRAIHRRSLRELFRC